MGVLIAQVMDDTREAPSHMHVQIMMDALVCTDEQHQI